MAVHLSPLLAHYLVYICAALLALSGVSFARASTVPVKTVVAAPLSAPDPVAARTGVRKIQPEPHAIVLAGDRDFAFPMTVALHSALYHFDPSKAVDVYLLSQGITPADQERSLRAVQGVHPRATIKWIDVDDADLSDLPTGLWHSRGMYLRLLIPSLLTDRYRRVLYMDGDIVVKRDLSALWRLDTGNHAVMAVPNFSEPTLGTAMPHLMAAIDAPPDRGYFNSGVLFMDLPRWRERRIVERTLEFIRRHREQLAFGDQDSLNAVFAGDWGQLDPAYNVQLLTLNRFGAKEGSDPHGLREQLLREAAMLHYTGPQKPWNLRYAGAASDDFLEAAGRSGWLRSPPALWKAEYTAAHFAVRQAAMVKGALRSRA
ncbi:glycosyltransferase family 8 protein [Sphingomonas sp. BN140010]|uniref:Glycosyltransferase family 8 protein n=1 Tax=Sphingomonas arvum TaxID=2992113 RepID=A0ABT3JHE3_9SPHN|nr:glycosyltransferase family 8 protein [Sphingomonas sp. BN140010]MCW3798492.1 glycosyltransferase family 8 protein [Sphingomonas sp. BN140010]